MLLEICCYSPAAAVLAAKAGAHRIELCDNPGEGGTTPSFGVLKWVRENVRIPVFPIIRPRGGHFVYTEEEISIMKDDIEICKQIGYEGIVIGILNKNGDVDFDQTAGLVELARPLEVTFHRAFDRVKEPFENLKKIINAGCSRLLTSGQTPDALTGISLITELVEAAENRIIIVPGAGIRSHNLKIIATASQAFEFHSSALKKEVEPFFIPETMEETLCQALPDEEEIKAMMQILKGFEGNGK
jgi:copper homeostasis protein